MDISITVPALYINVLKLFAGKNDVRHYLNGICLIVGNVESRLVATDGHRLGCFRLREKADIPKTCAFIIPNALLDNVKAKKQIDITVHNVTPDDFEAPPRYSPRKAVSIIVDERMTLNDFTVDGTYPDISSVFSEKVSGEIAQFNGEYLGDLDKVAKLLHPKQRYAAARTLAIGHNGRKGAVVDLGYDDFTCVLMPRLDKAPTASPSWVFDPVSKD